MPDVWYCLENFRYRRRSGRNRVCVGRHSNEKEDFVRILYMHNINRVAETYANELRRRGHTTELFDPSLVGGGAPLPIKIAWMPFRVLDMRHIVRKLNPNYFDIVHIHWASYGVFGSLAKKIPFIVHCHGSDVRYRLQ